jgi:TusA-related sulfurtransferase
MILAAVLTGPFFPSNLARANHDQKPASDQPKSQTHTLPCPMLMTSAKREVSTIENGARVRVTSDDPAVAKKIQANCAAHDEKLKAGGSGHQRQCPAAVEGAKMKVTKLPNGVDLDITADKPEAIKEIRARAARRAGDPARRSAPKKNPNRTEEMNGA